jgi:hypothetical protein
MKSLTAGMLLVGLFAQTAFATEGTSSSSQPVRVLVLEARGKERQYSETFKALGWQPTAIQQPFTNLSEALTGKDIVVGTDLLDLIPANMAEQLKAFLERGGALFLPDVAAVGIGAFLSGEKDVRTGAPAFYPGGSRMLPVGRFNKRSSLLNWPQQVPRIPEALYNPAGWQANHLNKFGFLGLPDDWGRIAYNVIDQPVLASKRIGRGLAILSPLPLWDTSIWDARFMAPLLANAVATVQSQGDDSAAAAWAAIESARVVSDTNAVLHGGDEVFPLQMSHVVSNSQWENSQWYRDGLASGRFTLKPWQEQVREVADVGCNTISFTVAYTKNPREVMDFAASLKLMVKPDTWGKLPLPEHPGNILMWDIIDEPDLHLMPVAEFVEFTRKTRAADPTTPIFVNVGIAKFDEYSKYGDIIGTDAYPVPIGPLTEISIRTRQARILTDGLPVVPYIQIYDIWNKRQPSGHEVRFMNWDCIVEGARGLVYYGYFPEEPGTLPSPYMSESPLWIGLKEINAEISGLTSYLLGRYIAPDDVPEYFVFLNSQQEIGRAVYVAEDGRGALLILTNRSGKQQIARFVVPTTSPFDSSDLSPITPTPSSEIFELPLAPWEVRIIKIRNSNKNE